MCALVKLLIRTSRAHDDSSSHSFAFVKLTLTRERVKKNFLDSLSRRRRLKLFSLTQTRSLAATRTSPLDHQLKSFSIE